MYVYIAVKLVFIKGVLASPSEINELNLPLLSSASESELRTNAPYDLGRSLTDFPAIFPRHAMHSTDYAVARYLSVRPSAGIVSKRLKISTNLTFFTIG